MMNARMRNISITMLFLLLGLVTISWSDPDSKLQFHPGQTYEVKNDALACFSFNDAIHLIEANVFWYRHGGITQDQAATFNCAVYTGKDAKVELLRPPTAPDGSRIPYDPCGVVNVKILKGTQRHDGQTAFMNADDLAGIDECTNPGN